MKKLLQIVKPILAIGSVAILIATGYFTRDNWLPLLEQNKTARSDNVSTASTKASDKKNAASEQIILSDQAIANLGLQVKSIQPETYWKTLQVPGMVVDRPGRSDRGIVSPVDGVVDKMNYFPGDTVHPGDVLYTIRILSESLQQTQSKLFKDTQDIKLAEAKKKRLESSGGAVPGARIIEVASEITRLKVAIKGYRQELLSRSFTQNQLNEVAAGNFVKELNILVPSQASESKPLGTSVVLQATGEEVKLDSPL